MKSQGEIEAAICEGISRFEQDYMGRGPKHIQAHLLDNLVVVRLQGVLTAAEQHLVQSLTAEKGRDLLKQVRTHLVETARPLMEAMIQEVTGAQGAPVRLPVDLIPAFGDVAAKRFHPLHAPAGGGCELKNKSHTVFDLVRAKHE